MDDHLPLQIPNFVYQQAPTLVPGGGAEVVPVSNAQWFVHNGFTPAAIDDSYFHSNSHQSTHHESTSSPFDFSEHTQQPQQQPEERPQPPPDFSVFLAPSPLGLPVYSQSGLDVIGLLTRVTNRPNPRIHLGPVDLSTAFCVVDTRRFDHPIVYCSETFCTLTGYSEKDVVGKNCRFLQAPGGKVAKGSVRTHTSPNAVNHLRKSLLADKECQTSIINYRNDGSVFINLVTVIPVPPLDDGEVIYQIGFQVDLNEQPNVILDKLRNGTYMVENNNTALAPPIHNQVQVYPGGRRISVQSAKDRKTHAIPR
ncbi:hypothetical protein D9619_013495 [Psilocybe cf. subviscida]|uniref:PAS domain-containing protein n=1 Tax=Psilocybe cf. subviscida TaxID=2480587 RepID=A0A8H5BHB1_9AGAR|nr:hypothetical protein D9619_013495 [Psilocybe cf. subviscida]